MTEIDTAIDGYDVYCDRLTAAAGASNGMTMQQAEETNLGSGMMSPSWSHPPQQQMSQSQHQQQVVNERNQPQTDNLGSSSSSIGAQGSLYGNPIALGLGMGMPTGGPAGLWGTEMGNGAQDWDFGLMLAGGH